jgi:Fe-S cluster biogenesis protein NfuA
VLERVLEVIENRIRPRVRMDGGDITLVDVEDGIVKIRLSGACSACASTQMTLSQGVERILRQEIPEIRGVEQV